MDFKYLNILKKLYKETNHLEGDFIEFGVFKGNSFLNMIKESKSQNKLSIAVDSFEGLAEPSEKDIFPDQNKPTSYLKGYLKCSINDFKNVLKDFMINKDYKIYKGFIPDVLQNIKENKICFAFIDLDHYYPTKYTLEWINNKIVRNGIIVCHDYFSGRNYFATPAIDEFINKNKIKNIIYDKEAYTIWWKND